MFCEIIIRMNLVNVENCSTFKLLEFKVLPITSAIFTEDKVTEIFFMVDGLCKLFAPR